MADEGLKKTGIELLAEGAAKFISDVNNSNNALADMASQGAAQASQGLDILGEIATGALRKIGELAVEGVMKLGDSLLDFVGDAMKAEQQQVDLNRLVDSSNAALKEQAAAYAAAANTIITTTAGSSVEISKLSDEYAKQSESLKVAEMRYAALKNPTEVQTYQIEQQRAKLTLLKDSLDQASASISYSAQSLMQIPVASGFTVESLNALANQFKDLAGGSDETVTAIEVMALKMGNITSDQMPQFIQTTLDLAAATGTDAASAARILAQAYDDPASAMGRFNRMGIRFTGDLDTQIKALVKAGDTAGAFALMMGRVSEATSGAAAGQANTLAGQIGIMKEHFLDAGKAIGEAMLPFLKTLFETVIVPAIPVVEEFAAQIGTLASGALATIVPIVSSLSESFQSAVSVIDSTYSPLEAITTVLGNLFLTLGNINPAFNDIGNALINLPETLKPFTDEIANLQAAFIAALPVIQSTLQNVVTWVVENWPKMQEAFSAVMNYIGGLSGSIMANIKNVFDTILPVITANVQNTLAQMQIFWTNHGDEIMTILAGMLAVVTLFINNVMIVIGATLTLISGIVSSFWSLVNGNTAQAQATMVTSLDTFLNMIIGMTGTDLATVRASWEEVFNDIYIIVTTVWANITTAISEAFTNISVSVMSWFINFVATWQGNWDMAFKIINTVWTNIETTINNTIARIQGIISGFIGSISDAFETAKSIAGAIADLAKNITGGGGEAGGARAEGGPVTPGKSYLVGERGPEQFVPQTFGMILPNSTLVSPPAAASSTRSYSNVTNNTYNLNANYSNPQSPGSLAQDVRMLQMLTA